MGGTPNVFGGGGLLGTGIGATPDAGEPSQAENLLTQLSKAQWEMGSPVRNEWLPQLLSALQGQTSPASLPGYAPLRAAAEAQYRNARGNVLESTPAGGGLTKALTNLEAQRAQGVGSLSADALQSLLDRAFQVGFGQAPSALSGLGASTAAASQRQSAQTQAEMAKGQGIGQAAGKAATAALMA